MMDSQFIIHIPMSLKPLIAFVIAASAFIHVIAESHTVTFVNDCGSGTPYLRAQNGTVLSTGEAYTINGPLVDGYAYLQTGACDDQGNNCTVVEFTLQNGDTSAIIDLVPPHVFSVATGYGFYNGCDGDGADCTVADCASAYRGGAGVYPAIPCAGDNVDLAVLFCD
ncbi:uncharacterized protein LAESUDRAFT_115317 [Laetiporus sulphureus 93-53]|uniref:Glycopeptide n=1 Tax=Laetiporus sulphureus 93-53 TaxID=1314785 RepID=A0A165EQF3_9APHY|nr:uncharacterized protein LAESUDRAFT_115317 [Laetiporus sulphureus 93-53]KZT07548.1 hypothetical protein LAESUDRAFT_115317 [Laetiporus sulphureus 93-53]